MKKILLLVGVMAFGCAKNVPVTPAETAPAAIVTPPAPVERTLTLATTTSTQASGLLDVLLPPFEKKTGIKVHVIAVGTGKALKLGENGDADILMVHDPEAEEKFMAKGFGVRRDGFMDNDFIIVGPGKDPARIQGTDAVKAFAKIQKVGVPFVSRGDSSGTHMKEKILWNLAGGLKPGKWYLEAGQGMSETLMMASEKEGYTLADRGTWLNLMKKIPLAVLVEGDTLLVNPYSVISVNPSKHPALKAAEAKELHDWLLGEEARGIINGYTIEGRRLFRPKNVKTVESPKDTAAGN